MNDIALKSNTEINMSKIRAISFSSNAPNSNKKTLKKSIKRQSFLSANQALLNPISITTSSNSRL